MPEECLDVLRRESEAVRSEEGTCDDTFNRLKECLCSEPILRCPDFSLLFVLKTDASGRAIGAVLSQLVGNGEEHPVAYYSRKLLPREEKYSTVEKECLAIIQGIQTFRVYLDPGPLSQACGSLPLFWVRGGPIYMPRQLGPPRTQMPRHMGPGNYLYIQASWSV